MFVLSCSHLSSHVAHVLFVWVCFVLCCVAGFVLFVLLIVWLSVVCNSIAPGIPPGQAHLYNGKKQKLRENNMTWRP